MLDYNKFYLAVGYASYRDLTLTHTDQPY